MLGSLEDFKKLGILQFFPKNQRIKKDAILDTR